MTQALLKTSIQSLPLISQGKVRDVYAVSDQYLLMIATDRLSAFDVVMQEPIPGKGIVLNTMANFWFEHLKHILPNHLTGIDPATVVQPDEIPQVLGRAVVVHRLKPLLVEAVVRGYLSGSGWQDYQATGAVCGVKLPAGLQNAEVLKEPIFTPAAKAAAGDHDENISFDAVIRHIGESLAVEMRTMSLRLYQEAAAYAAQKGIIIADTKFEFGLNAKGQMILMDEVLTADSSRFWPVASYGVGQNPPSFDKQFVRDWLESVQIAGRPWNKKAPAPHLPSHVIAQTAAKYQEALSILTR